jgi:hypothetical protein
VATIQLPYLFDLKALDCFKTYFEWPLKKSYHFAATPETQVSVERLFSIANFIFSPLCARNETKKKGFHNLTF